MTNPAASGVETHGATFAEKNATHSTSQGAWPQWVLDLHQQISDFLTSPECPTWLGVPSSTDSRLLDYACGNGMLSRALKPLFASSIGMDVSTGMLDLYRATASSLGLGPDAMMAVRGDLTAAEMRPTDPPLSEDKLWNFDLVAISMTLHHLEDPPVALSRLAAHLKPGGTLLVIDWTPQDGSTSAQQEYAKQRQPPEQSERELQKAAARHTISKPNGFTRGEMESIFEQCECKDFRWKLCEELSDVLPTNSKHQLFFARATRL